MANNINRTPRQKVTKLKSKLSERFSKITEDCGRLSRKTEDVSIILKKIGLGVYGPLPKILTLFMTKICDIPYPIYDLTKNSKPLNQNPVSDLRYN